MDKRAAEMVNSEQKCAHVVLSHAIGVPIDEADFIFSPVSFVLLKGCSREAQREIEEDTPPVWASI